MKQKTMQIFYGPPVYRPILGEEGGEQRVQFGLFTRGKGLPHFYLAVRLLGRWFRWAPKL